MYLAKLSMDIRHPSIRQALKDQQDMHRNLMHSYEQGFLYRIIEGKDKLELLTLSKQKPDCSELERRGFHLENIQDMSGLSQKYGTDTMLRFNLLAAPSKKIYDVSSNKNSRRVYLSTPEQRAEWLKRQGTKYGFEILEVYEPSAEKKLTINRKSGMFNVTAIELSGVLKSLDAPKFWSSWEKGIGPEKAYGLGLMCLSR